MPPSPTPSQATVETNSSLFIPPSSSTPDSFGTPNSFSTAQNLPRGGLSRRATVEESLDETERQRPVIRDARQVRWASSPEVIEHTGGYADSDVPTLQDGEYVMSGSPTATKSKRKRRHSLITSTQEESSSNKSLESLELSWRQLPHSIPPRPTRDSTYAYSPDPSEHVSSRHGYAWYPSQGIPPGSIYARDYARYQSPRLRQRASLLPYGGRPAISVPPPPSAGRYSVYELGLRSQTPQPTLTHDTPFLPFITGDNRPHYTAFDNGIQYIQQGEWQTLADTLRIHDHGQIESCDKSIDALLVFTGLFSAVVAAFTIESYKSLQEDPSITSAAFLALISRQLSDLASGSSQTSTSTPAPSFKAAPSDVRINAAWFTSLVCSLVTASLALFVKQCLRNYLHGHYSSPQERIRVRHFRYQGLIRWRVFELAAALPLLLQLGLLLFLLGMSEFLRPLDLAVGWTITGLIILWLMAVVLIVFAPAVSSDCPYRIPILINVATSIRGLIARLRFGRKWRARMGYTNGYYAFPGDEKGLRREGSLDAPALGDADNVLMDDVVLQNCLRYCCANLDPRDSLRFICRVVENRIGKPVRSIADFDEYHLIPTRALNALTEMMCDTLENISSSSGTVLQPEDDPVHSSWHCYVDLVTGLSRIVDHAVTKERQAHVVAWGRARGLVANAPANFLDEKENTEPYIRILMKMNTKPLINPSHLVEARMLNFLSVARSLPSTLSSFSELLALGRATFELLGTHVQQSRSDTCHKQFSLFSAALELHLQDRPKSPTQLSGKDVGEVKRILRVAKKIQTMSPELDLVPASLVQLLESMQEQAGHVSVEVKHDSANSTPTLSARTRAIAPMLENEQTRSVDPELDTVPRFCESTDSIMNLGNIFSNDHEVTISPTSELSRNENLFVFSKDIAVLDATGDVSRDSS